MAKELQESVLVGRNQYPKGWQDEPRSSALVEGPRAGAHREKAEEPAPVGDRQEV